jgi:hypothetical protein
MADIDLRELPANEFVVHFGGLTNEIDALTFANALIGVTGAFREISRQISPELDVEVLVDGVGPGSFRAKLRTSAKSAGRLFATGAVNVALGVLASVIYDKIADHKQEIIVQGDVVIIQQGNDRIILPKAIWDEKQRLPNPGRVDRHVSKTFKAVEDDPAITDFGFFRHLKDDQPLTLVPRGLFPVLAEPSGEDRDGRRSLDERASLTVVKAVFERGGRKWEFVWNGLKISAPITDASFFDRLASRQIWLAQGDQMDAVLRIHQRFDDVSGVYINERYEIAEVLGITHKGTAAELPLADA